ncbi:hypothetical protein KJ810_01870 [Patescibacteria group bacterium]|nr:hypothetical protein [Patescibacteria group bacterium]
MDTVTVAQGVVRQEIPWWIYVVFIAFLLFVFFFVFFPMIRSRFLRERKPDSYRKFTPEIGLMSCLPDREGYALFHED